MTRFAWRVVFVVIALLCVTLLWYYAGAAVAAALGVVFGSGGALHRRRKTRPRIEPLAETHTRDALADQERAARATWAAESALRAAGEGWVERPSRDRPRLPGLLLWVLGSLVPSLGRANEPPIVTPDCVPVARYGEHAHAAGYGIWRESGATLWCRCLPADRYGETTRMPSGCIAEMPLIGYTIAAHQGVSADIARASKLIASLRIDLLVLRNARDTRTVQVSALLEEAQDAEQRERRLATDLHRAQQSAEAWFTIRSITLAVLSVVATTGTYYVSRKVLE